MHVVKLTRCNKIITFKLLDLSEILVIYPYIACIGLIYQRWYINYTFTFRNATAKCHDAYFTLRYL